MPIRPATFASAIAFSLLAGVPSVTFAQGTDQGAPAAAGDCLSGPNNPAPAGSRWRYHIDRASKRHCWYLKEGSDARAPSARTAAAANSPTPAQPLASSAPAPMQGSVADAHAELLAPQPAGAAAPARAATPWPAPTPAAAGSAQPANAMGVNAQRSQIASRWPGQSDVGAGASQASPDDAGAQPSTATTSAAATLPPPVVATVPPPARPSGSIQTLLLVMTGALALAGLVGGAVVRFGRGRSTPQPERRLRWDPAITDLAPQPGYPSAGAPMSRLGLPNELRKADDPDQRVANMLARLARSARA